MLEFAAEPAAAPATRRGAVWNAGMDSAAGCFPTEFCAQHMAALFSLAGWIAGRSPDVLGIVFVCPVGIGRARSQDVGFSADDPAYRGRAINRKTAGRACPGLLRSLMRGAGHGNLWAGGRIINRHCAFHSHFSGGCFSVFRFGRNVAFDATGESVAGSRTDWSVGPIRIYAGPVWHACQWPARIGRHESSDRVRRSAGPQPELVAGALFGRFVRT